MSTSSINRTTCAWILNRPKIVSISTYFFEIFQFARSTREVTLSTFARSILLLPCVARSYVAWSIFLRLMNFDRSIDYKVDRSICLSWFFNWPEQTWTLEMIETILNVFSGPRQMFWISFQLRPENKTKHKSTTNHYIYNTN